MRNIGRFFWRAIWLCAEVLLVGARFLFLYGFTLGRPTIHQRAVCLHRGCHRVLRVFVQSVEVTGPRPGAGLLVSNHLSYLDILLLSSLAPVIFVSKVEVRQWPVFGWFAALGGTVFVRRERRGEVGSVAGEIQRLLAEDQIVVLFPEGTSSGGETVLPFKSSLLEPVVGQSHGVHAACIAYSIADGLVGEDVCYWGDMTLVPHLVKLLGKAAVRARVRFSEVREPATDRKALARQLHEAVSNMHSTTAAAIAASPR